jgi:hypothetical protein
MLLFSGKNPPPFFAVCFFLFFFSPSVGRV